MYVAGGRVWVWPVVQQVQRISLNTMTLEVVSPKVYTKLGVPISVTGIAQVSHFIVPVGERLMGDVLYR